MTMKYALASYLLLHSLIGYSQNWELVYEDSMDTRSLTVVDDTLYFTRNVPTSPTTYVNHLYRSVVPDVILDSVITINGIYYSSSFDRHNGQNFLMINAPFAATVGLYDKQAGDPFFTQTYQGATEYLLDKANSKIYITDFDKLLVSNDQGQTLSTFWTTNDEGSFHVLGVHDNAVWVALNTADINALDSIGIWKISNNGSVITQMWNSVFGNNLFFPDSRCFYVSPTGRMYTWDYDRIAYSDDNGSNWTLQDIDYTNFVSSMFQISNLVALPNGDLLISVYSNAGASSSTLTFKTLADGTNIQVYGGGLPSMMRFSDLTLWNNNIYGNGPKGIYRLNAPLNTAEESITQTNVLVYPNPTSSDVCLNGLEPGSIIDIQDATGKTVYKMSATDAVQTLTLSNVAAGSYYMHITSKQHRTTQKLIIQK